MTLAAALVEAGLLRFLLRLGPLLPPTPLVRALGQAGMVLGTAALNLAYLLGTIALLGGGWIAVRKPRHREQAAGLFVIGAMALGLAADALHLSGRGVLPASLFLVAHVLALAALGALLASMAKKGPPAVVLWPMIAAYAASSLSAMGPPAAAMNLPWPDGAITVAVAEGLAVGAALVVLPAYRPPASRRAFLVATLGGALLVGMALGRPWLPSAFAIWNFAFTLFLPFWLYVIALWLYLYTLAACWASGQPIHREVALGLALVALGGLRADFSYTQRLALLGLWQLGYHSPDLPTRITAPQRASERETTQPAAGPACLCQVQSSAAGRHASAPEEMSERAQYLSTVGEADRDECHALEREPERHHRLRGESLPLPPYTPSPSR